MKSFSENRHFIENEFEEAFYDASTGLDENALLRALEELKIAGGDLPYPIVYAKAYAFLLDHVQLQINEHTPFSVKLNLGVNYSYFASNTLFERAFPPRTEQIRREKLPDEYKRFQPFASVGLDWMGVDFTHTVPNWNYLLQEGFCGILSNAKASKKALAEDGALDDRRSVFLDSVIICYEAILRLLERIYDYSLRFDVPDFSECIKNLTVSPPKTLYEVMQLSVLYVYLEEIGAEKARSLGAIDTLYLPYYENDKKRGVPEEDLKDLFRYFFIHFTAAKRFAEEPLTLCGSSMDGKDLSNDLTRTILDIYDSMNIFNPKLHIRCHRSLARDIFRRALSMIRGGNNSICLINDEAVFKGYDKLGIPRTDSQHYVISGCYEPIILGLEEAEICAMRFNTVKCVEFAINGGRDIKTGILVGSETPLDIPTFEDFFAVFLKQLNDCTDFALDFIQKQGRFSTLINPSPIYSSSFPECIRRGMDVHEHPLKYNNISLKHHGLATTVDSLLAIKKYVYDQRVLTLAEMRQALLDNWSGFEDLRTRIVKDTEKYGNNFPLPDKIMTDILDNLASRYTGKQLERDGKVRLGLDSVYHCIKHGELTAATPNGRRAGEPLSKNLCATDGMDRGGITAYMQSVLKIDTSDFVDGVPFDFILHPTAVEGARGLDAFEALIKIFFECGGFAAQGNIVSGELLRNAQKDPEKYATLQVRVCGWNEYFVHLSKLKQDMFIKQCEGDDR